jgi:citrate lyase gamma subunit
MFDFLRGRKTETIEAIARQAFAAGLESGIGMVRIAAARGREISLDDLADVMQQTLDEFSEGS